MKISFSVIIASLLLSSDIIYHQKIEATIKAIYNLQSPILYLSSIHFKLIRLWYPIAEALEISPPFTSRFAIEVSTFAQQHHKMNSG